MKTTAILAAIVIASGCASAPGMRVVADTECIQEVTINTSMISDFAAGPVSGCGQRAYTGKFYTARPRIEVDPAHIINVSGRLMVSPEFESMYGGAK